MANPYFQFKQFTVRHDRCAMKVNTDSVLLGAWVDIMQPSSILDIGLGSGLLALMMAQRFAARVDGVELDREAYLQALENAQETPWANQFTFFNIDFLKYCESSSRKYDLILTNPPYFSNSLKNPEKNKMNARHTDCLPIDKLLKGVRRLLKDDGVFATVQPYENNAIEKESVWYGLYGYRQMHVRSAPDKPFYLTLAQYRRQAVEIPEISELSISDGLNGHSDAYKKLTKDFYLKF